MLNRIHFNKQYLKVKTETYKVIEDYNVKARKSYTYPVFLPIKVERPDMAYNMRIVYMDKKHVDYLDVVHTMAYLETSVVGKNVLTLERQFGRFGWKIYENDKHIMVHIDKNLLRLIQYGFGCKIACYEKTRKHIYNIPQYAFIVRAWMDTDRRIFKHALHSLSNLLIRKVTYAADEFLDIIRELPNLMEKFGDRWENAMVKHYIDDNNPFLLSLLCFLCPGANLDNLYITEEGMNILSSPWAPSTIKDFYAEKEQHKCKNGTYKLVSNNCGNMWKPLYQYILSHSCSAEQSFKLFLSVKRTRNTLKTIGKKREFVSTKRTDLKTKEITKQVYNGGYFTHQGKQMIKTNMLHLAKLIVLCEMRKNYRSHRWQGFGYTPEEYTNMAGNDNLLPFVEDLLRTRTKIEPLVQLPKGIKTCDGKCDVNVSSSFPVLKFSKKYGEELKNRIGANKYNYFGTSVVV